jgi:hypothetical protein
MFVYLFSFESSKLTKWLTSWGRPFLRGQTFPQLLKKFSEFYETWRFITAVTRARLGKQRSRFTRRTVLQTQSWTHRYITVLPMFTDDILQSCQYLQTIYYSPANIYRRYITVLPMFTDDILQSCQCLQTIYYSPASDYRRYITALPMFADDILQSCQCLQTIYYSPANVNKWYITVLPMFIDDILVLPCLQTIY